MMQQWDLLLNFEDNHLICCSISNSFAIIIIIYYAEAAEPRKKYTYRT